MSKARKKYSMTPAALAQRRAGLQKARATPEEKIYRATERRQAASRANMKKAIAVRKSETGVIAARLNAATHGYFIKDLAGSFRRMREDPAEFDQLLKLFEGIFVPRDAEEKEWVRGIAESSWKRLRLFRAQAVWEMKRLKELLKSIDTSRPPTPLETHRRAARVYLVLDYYADYIDVIARHRHQIQRLLNKLILKRTQGAFQLPAERRRGMRYLSDEFDRRMAQPLEEFIAEEEKKLEKR